MATSAAARARWAVTAVFAGNGLVISSLVVRAPSLKADLGLSDAQLGLVSALFGVSAVVAMQTTGGLTARFGSGWIVRAVTLLLPVALVGVGVAPGLALLAAVHLALGVVHGTLDVAMNTHAVAVERALGRPIMNGCHAAWSIGAVVGSLLGSAAAHLGLSRSVHYALLAGLLLPGALLCGRALLPGSLDRGTAAGAGPVRSGWRAGWTRRVLVLGAMGAIALTAEAAVASWSGVFLNEYVGASLGVAAIGYAAFTTCQTAGRLVGDRLQARHSATHLVRWSAVVAAAGMAVAVLGPWPALVIAGFALVGLGLATPLPVLFSVVGHLGAGAGGRTAGGGRDAGAAAMVARFTTMTYTGVLLGPGVIGWVAELVGLTWTLAALIPLLLAVAYAAGAAATSGDSPAGGDRPTGGDSPSGGDRRASPEPVEACGLDRRG